ncbi:MAG: hypothetical protein ACYS7Y_26930 [Planctomycetota bacterium]|jgi:hypothetical protein
MIWKWFRNRQRIKRRLRLAAAGWMVLLVFCVGCELPENEKPAFRKGQFVEVKISGRRGQILSWYRGFNGPLYNVRVETPTGPEGLLLSEFEITLVVE